jgi:two-component system OmpR family sensor kinase
MTRRLGAFIRAPLFVQVLALMVATFIVAQIGTFVVVLSLPRASPVTYYFTEIVRAYNGQPPAPNDKTLIVEDNVAAPDASFTPTSENSGINRTYRRALGERLTPVVPMEKVFMHTGFAHWREYLGQRPRSADANGDYWIVAPFQIRVQQPDGHWREIRTPFILRLDPFQRAIAIVLLMSSLAVIAAAWMSARVLAAPIVSFAAAAERLGRDPNASPLSLRGSTEIVSAATAFNEMQQRLRRYVEDRTAMIGAIAHDLRTPLTRLRFRIEAVPEDVRSKMSSDLDQMEAMISATLSFVRDATQEGARTRLELSSLLESLVDDMIDTGANVKMEHADKIIIDGDPVGLKRLFSNLLENAVKYGKSARVRVIAENNMTAVVEIDDDGPGVPAAEAERVFEPFYRREPSRNRDTGGIGLGLAVVRTIARGHGGDAELENRQGGGLTARVKLPL